MAGAVAVIYSAPDLAQAYGALITLDDCMSMTPEQVARKSDLVMNSWEYLSKTVASIRNDPVRKIVEEIIQNPAPTFTERFQDPSVRRTVWQELVAKGYLKDRPLEELLPPVRDVRRSEFAFVAAPGSGYQSHHSYPGGLITHTALNVKVSLALWQGYREIDDLALDRDVVIASQVLHDLHKPWVFQWRENAESRAEKPLAGTGEHHLFSIAESYYRGLPPEICVAQACAHQHPGTPQEEAEVVGWIKAVSILLGVNPVEKNLLGPTMNTLPEPRSIENFVCHLGDHDWVISVPSAQWMIPILKTVAKEEYGMSEQDLAGKKFNAFRNYVFSQKTIMGLYQIYTSRGKRALVETVASLVKPV
jgi:hypothetical protein